MSLFLQLAMEDRFGLPFEAGSVLSVFQCIEHDDPFEELDMKSPKKRGDPLPDYYWNHTNYALFFAEPDRAQQLPDREAWVHYSRLVIEPDPEPPSKSVAALNYPHIKIGGPHSGCRNRKSGAALVVFSLARRAATRARSVRSGKTASVPPVYSPPLTAVRRRR